MKYGPARISTVDRDTAIQLAALKQAGCKTFFAIALENRRKGQDATS